MKKFRFTLQVLLDVRKREEKNAMNELSAKRAELFQLENQLEQIKNEVEQSEIKMAEIVRNPVSPVQLQRFHIYLSKLKDRAQELRFLVSNAEKQCDILLNKLVEIKKMVKTLETLKEQKYGEYLKESEKEEMKILDDFINSREIQKLIPHH